eukprot:6258139-Amphidinium_carterae.1
MYPIFVSQALEQRLPERQVLWRAITLNTASSQGSPLTDATFFNTLGGAISWHLSQHVWLQSENHSFSPNFGFACGVVAEDHDALFSSDILPGHWSQRTRFNYGSDSAFIPLAIIKTSITFNEMVVISVAVTVEVVSDFGEIYEIKGLHPIDPHE